MERGKPVPYAEFASLVRRGSGYLKVLVERAQGHEVTEEQIKAWYHAYLGEGGWR